MTDRTQYIAGLRAIADFLEANTDLPLPNHRQGHHRGLTVHDTLDWRPTLTIGIYASDDDALARDRFAQAARLLKPVNKHYDHKHGGAWLWREFAGIDLAVRVDRDQVCERVVVDVREWTEEVPDPDAVAALPKVAVPRREEVVEWRCSPVLEAADQ